MQVLAFDIYGTILNAYAMEKPLRKAFGEQSHAANELWREKQIEYSFRRALMRCYKPFQACTEDALKYVSQKLSVPLSKEDFQELMSEYQNLPPFSDVADGLDALKQTCRLVAFSNGTAESLRKHLEKFDLLRRFEDIVSVDEVQTFKPNVLVYQHLVTRVGGVPKDSVCLVSSNAWDVMGAKASGLRAAWIQRDPTRIFDPWGEYQPDVVVHSMQELVQAMEQLNSSAV